VIEVAILIVNAFNSCCVCKYIGQYYWPIYNINQLKEFMLLLLITFIYHYNKLY